jgi:hypothetical protein
MIFQDQVCSFILCDVKESCSTGRSGKSTVVICAPLLYYYVLNARGTTILRSHKLAQQQNELLKKRD